ncbi:MAG TPA: TonB-dependent receptor plug domain-containing protein, partial [Paludibacter sp.]
MTSLSAQQQSVQTNQKRISGTVKDEQGIPLPGVNIKVQGSSLGTITDMDGKYMITIPGGNVQLEFSFVGYDLQKVAAEKTVLNITLVPSNKSLDEVVVVGYGTQRKKDLTGSVTSVSAKDFNPGVIGSPAELINGKVAGVQIMSNSGSPSAGSTIRIRGGASLNASNDPLIVIDGVPLENGGISGNGSNFLSLLNPNDIENISILKDASSTAIYGSRASNGVLMITTKKGNLDKLKINFNTSFSQQEKTRLADMLSPDQFRNLIN